MRFTVVERVILEYLSPFGYELEPLNLRRRSNTVTLKMKNIDNTLLENIAVELYSIDNNAIKVDDPLQRIGELKPDETKEVPIRVTAYLSTDVYARATALKTGVPLKWESSVIYLTVPGTNIPENEQATG